MQMKDRSDPIAELRLLVNRLFGVQRGVIVGSRSQFGRPQ